MRRRRQQHRPQKRQKMPKGYVPIEATRRPRIGAEAAAVHEQEPSVDSEPQTLWWVD
jgi:hypothetical protein